MEAPLSASSTAAVGVQATNLGEVLVNGGTIAVNAQAAVGAQADVAGKVQLSLGTIDVNADAAIGMHAKGLSSVATMKSGIINVKGTNGLGMKATAQGLAVAEGGEINVDVSTGIGAQATAAGQFQLSGATINVKADNAIGMDADAQSSIATMKSGTINVAGDGGVGVRAHNQGKSVVQGGLIKVTGNNGVGGQTFDKGVLELSAGVIQLDGNHGYGLQALADSSIIFSDANVSINLNGTNNTALNTKGNQAKITGTGNITVKSTALGSRAALAEANSSIDLSSGLFTSTTEGTGVQADGQGALVSLSRANITSAQSSGLYATNNGSIRIAEIAQVTSQADGQHAALVEGGGRLTGQTLDLITTGAKAAGLAVMSPTAAVSTAPDADLAVVRVRTSGVGADGIRVGGVMNAGYVKVSDGVDIQVSGVPATGSGCDVGAGICMTSDKSRFELGGANASQIQSSGYGLRMASGNNMSMFLSNVQVSVTGTSAAIDFHQVAGDTMLTLENSQINSSPTASLISMDASSAATLQSVGSLLYGVVSAAPSSVLKVNLTKSSHMSGAFNGVANLNIDSSSVWKVASDSSLYKIENSGIIDFTESNTLTKTYRKVITDGYKGNGGKLYLETFLENDQSLSDQLVIRKNISPNPSNNPAFENNTEYSGKAVGVTYVYVTNRGGLGAYSTGKGIKVVDADTDPNASTAVNAFVQGHTISAGAYDYTLYRNADKSWYLFSSKDQNLPDYSDESSGTVVLGPLAQIYGSATLGSWRERMGGMAYADLTQANQPRSAAGPLWVRVGGGRGKNLSGAQYKATATSVAYSPDYDYNISFLQMGADLYQRFGSKGSRYVAGAYITTGSIHGDVHTYDELTAARRSNAAQDKLKNTSLGGYWTMVTPNGSYVDVVGQYTTHDLTVQGASAQQTGHGRSWNASVEAGQALPLNASWTLVPQAQLHWQDIRLQPMTSIASQSNVGVYSFDNNNSLQARLGLEVRYQPKPRSNAWLRLDVLHEFKGNYTASYKPEQTSSEHPQFMSTRKGTLLALLAGMELELDKNVALYGAAGYQHALSSQKGSAWNVQIGARWGF